MYLGNDLTVAYPNYRNIDDISASFNGSTTSFALLVNGAAPVPQPLNSQQCLISVGGVLQRPDDTGSEGFRLSGGNIIFSSAPATSEDFFGVVLAGADYVNAGANFPDGQVGAPSITFDQDNDTGFYRSGSGAVSFTSNGVGTATFGSASFVAPSFIPTSSTAPTNGVYLPAANSVAISTNSTERTRIDSSGRLLVGTSTARSNVYVQSSNITPQNQFETAIGSYNSGLSLINCSSAGYGPVLTFGQSLTNTLGGNALSTNGVPLGEINFTGNDGTNFRTGAHIRAEVDGNSSAGDMPGRLMFSTTKDGQSSPTEAMRINQSGNVWVGNQGNARSSGGSELATEGYIYTNVNAGPAAYFNRFTNDGTIVELRQDNVAEGTISVSGTTVSYNGAHLSRWSQLPSGAEREEILRGTVLSNLDEMCEWGEEDNEQLNRMKVSDVEGDKNVSGVFQCWDDDDDTYTNDFYCAMTGDFIIRIAEGTPVHRGQLLMSAGDGTAKPQDDDIIRSKTIAKVTSTTVSCTYEDGSYCVPCVLMAC